MIARNSTHFFKPEPFNVSRPFVQLPDYEVRKLPKHLNDILEGNNCLHNLLYVRLTYNSSDSLAVGPSNALECAKDPFATAKLATTVHWRLTEGIYESFCLWLETVVLSWHVIG